MEEILINVTLREVRVALLEKSHLQEIHIERGLHQGLLGNIYKGRVKRLMPGIQAAFIDIGLERSAFLHISDISGYEKVVSSTNNVRLDIRDILRVGQELLVQVYKDTLGSKGARLTTIYTLPARYLVLTPGNSQIAVSQRVTNEAERHRLINLITPSEQGGFIFRTAAEGVAQSDLNVDKEFLSQLWIEITEKATRAKVGDLVYEEIPLALRVVRDLAGYEVKKIRVDDALTAEKMQQFAQHYAPALASRIEYYDKALPIFDLYALDDELQKTLQQKVYLKSGGHLVFDQTEAMTTIDVNTGSHLGNTHLEQTIFATNLEAIEAIAWQVRLRNLGGIIIIDFIDMMDPSHKTQLLQALTQALAKDSARTEVSELTSLGLVQMTRKRTRESLEHILCVPCPLCQRRGSIKSLPTVCYELFRAVQRTAQSHPAWPGFLIKASQSVIKFLLDEESTMLAQLETQLGKPIQLQVELSLTQEYYDILPLG